MDTVFLIQTAMFGNGSVIGMIAVIMPAHQATIPQVLLLEILVCCAAVRGSTTNTTSAPPIATGTIQRIRAAATSVSVAPAHHDSGMLYSDILNF